MHRVLSLGLVVVMLSTGCAQDSLLVKDDQGRTRLELTATDQRTELAIFSVSGVKAITLSTDHSDGGLLRTNPGAGGPAFPQVTLRGNDGSVRLRLRVGHDGSASVDLMSADSYPHVRMSVREDGETAVSVIDRFGIKRVDLP